jgi:hypothetical protein
VGKKKGRKEMVTDRWDRTTEERAAEMTKKSTGMTEKRTEMTPKRRNDWEKRRNDWPTFLFPPFSFSNNSILFEFNSYALNQIKFMHQHECTNMLNLK